jgi:hypothetical protein
MREKPARLVTNAVFGIAVTISLMTIASSALAQQPAPNPKLRDRQREVREKTLQSTEMPVRPEEENPRLVLARVEEVKEDFRRIQIVRNEMVRILTANKPLDYNVVFDEVGEINKRADRLKKFLLPPIHEDKEKNQIDFSREEMKGAMVRLCNLIVSFVDNPVLKNPGTTDVQQSTKAGTELLHIVELSGEIKRSAEKLKRTSS